MEKAQRVLRDMEQVHWTRDSRLQRHLWGFDRCRHCRRFRDYDGEKVDYCAEAQRLANRVRSLESRARVLTLLVLENVHARG